LGNLPILARYSDPLLIDLAGGEVQFQRIHRYPTGSTYTVTAKQYMQVVGERVCKAGRTTHETCGRIMNICVDNGHPDYPILYCQNLARLVSSGDDSGSPIFKKVGVGQVRWLGIHWGAFVSGPFAGRKIYSPVSGIEIDQCGSTGCLSLS